MIRPCDDSDFESIYAIINDGAEAYRGIIPSDRWAEPYMPREKLGSELAAGILFWGYEEDGVVGGVMGVQQVQDVTLIRHAYVRTSGQRRGIGGRLLAHLLGSVDRPVLIGTWADARWAIEFYQRYGFQAVSGEEKDRLLHKYWTVPKRQIETSVVLADSRWRDTQPAH